MKDLFLLVPEYRLKKVDKDLKKTSRKLDLLIKRWNKKYGTQ